MPHLCLSDDTVLFADAFGLTRVAPNGRPKTDTKVYAPPLLPLSVGGSPLRVFVHGPSAYQNKVLAVDDLKRVAAPAGGDAMLPDGERFVCAGIGDVRNARNELLSNFDHRHAPRRECVTLNAGLFHPARVMVTPAVSDDGRIAFLWSGVDDCELALVDTSPTTARTRWRVELRAGSDTIIAPQLIREGVAVVGWRPVAAKATVVDLDADGALRASREIDAVGMPAVDEDRAVFQRDEATVTVLDRRAGTSRDVDLAALVAGVPRKKTAPAPLDPRGVGTVIAGRGRTLFVPWHGETLLDFDRSVEIDRKLSATQRPHRAAFSQWMRDQRGPLLAHGIVGAIQFRCDGSPTATLWSCMRSNGSVQETLAMPKKLASHLEERTGLRLRGYGTVG